MTLSFHDFVSKLKYPVEYLRLKNTGFHRIFLSYKGINNQRFLSGAAVFVDGRVACIEILGVKVILDDAEGFTETGRLK